MRFICVGRQIEVYVIKINRLELAAAEMLRPFTFYRTCDILCRI